MTDTTPAPEAVPLELTTLEDFLLDGTARILAAAAEAFADVPGHPLARLVYRGVAAGEPTTSAHVYQPGEASITLRVHPDRGEYVALTDYPIEDHPSLSDSAVGVQLTIRGSAAFVSAASGLAFDALHGRWGGMVGVVHLVNAGRASGTQLGQDSSERQGRSDNYRMDVNRPSTHRS